MVLRLIFSIALGKGNYAEGLLTMGISLLATCLTHPLIAMVINMSLEFAQRYQGLRRSSTFLRYRGLRWAFLIGLGVRVGLHGQSSLFGMFPGFNEWFC